MDDFIVNCNMVRATQGRVRRLNMRTREMIQRYRGREKTREQELMEQMDYKLHPKAQGLEGELIRIGMKHRARTEDLILACRLCVQGGAVIRELEASHKKARKIKKDILIAAREAGAGPDEIRKAG